MGRDPTIAARSPAITARSRRGSDGPAMSIISSWTPSGSTIDLHSNHRLEPKCQIRYCSRFRPPMRGEVGGGGPQGRSSGALLVVIGEPSQSPPAGPECGGPEATGADQRAGHPDPSHGPKLASILVDRRSVQPGGSRGQHRSVLRRPNRPYRPPRSPEAQGFEISLR